MTHKNDRVLSVKELARVEGESALHLLLGSLPGPGRRKIII